MSKRRRVYDDWVQYFQKEHTTRGNMQVFTCRLCVEGGVDPSEAILLCGPNDSAKRKRHVEEFHTKGERVMYRRLLETRIRGSPLPKELEDVRGILTDFIIRVRMPLSIVEKPQFKRICGLLNARFPSSRSGLASLLIDESNRLRESLFPRQDSPVPVGLVLDRWKDTGGTHHYCVMVSMHGETLLYRQHSTSEKQDADWLSEQLARDVEELSALNYRVVGMTADNATVSSAAWSSIQDRIAFRQPCVCHSMNLCLKDALNSIGAIEKMEDARDYLRERETPLS